jgi:hypothetical protein
VNVIKKKQIREDEWAEKRLFSGTVASRRNRLRFRSELVLCQLSLTLLSDDFRREVQRVPTYGEAAGAVHALAVPHVGKLQVNE